MNVDNPALAVTMMRDWQGIFQQMALKHAGTPEADTYLSQSKRYGFAAEQIKAMMDRLAVYEKVASDPVEGDLLPAVGEVVEIHLNSSNTWEKHTVTGYYVWAAHSGAENLHRVSVRVVDSNGYPNARSLSDIRRLK